MPPAHEAISTSKYRPGPAPGVPLANGPRKLRIGGTRTRSSRGARILESLVHAAAKDLPLEPDVVLVALHGGLRAAAAFSGMSERTLRRRFAPLGGGRFFLRELRRQAGIGLVQAGVPLPSIANYLGFSSASSLRRFLRRETAQSLPMLRAGRQEKVGR